MKIKNIQQVKDQIALLKKNIQDSEIMAGFVDETLYQPTKNRKDVIPVAVVARKLEEGWIERRPAETLIAWDATSISLPSRVQIVPPRPFLKSAFAINEESWKDLFILTLLSTLDLKKSLEVVGHRMSLDIKLSIINFTSPNNAPLTIRLKGFDNPLIETGQMLNDVNYTYSIGKASNK